MRQEAVAAMAVFPVPFGSPKRELPMTYPEFPPQMPGSKPVEFLDLSWEMFGELCRALALRVARDFEPDLIVGIARAGVFPGAVVASVLRKDFYSLTISRREGGAGKGPTRRSLSCALPMPGEEDPTGG